MPWPKVVAQEELLRAGKSGIEQYFAALSDEYREFGNRRQECAAGSEADLQMAEYMEVAYAEVCTAMFSLLVLHLIWIECPDVGHRGSSES